MSDVAELIKRRYGAGEVDASRTAANQTLETLLQHKSVRAFLPEPVSAETLQTIVAAAQSAPTSSNLQTWSVVAIRDPERKDKAATLAGNQAFIREAPLFLIFCADLNRLTKISGQQGKPGSGLEYLEMFLMASVDASLAAQNALVAAESLGLGGCYVGAVRNRAEEIAELLGLPPRVFAVFGMALGVPDPSRASEVKPRLPQNEILHLDTWREPRESVEIAEYDEILAKFNASQSRGHLPKWTQTASDRVATRESLSGRHVLRDVLTNRGFDLK